MLILFSTVLFNLAYNVKLQHPNTLIAPDYIGIIAAMIALFSGGFLVVPKGYQISTPWITVAFVLVTLVIAFIGLSILIKSRANIRLNKLLTLNYSLVAIFLIALVHDAVSKHTLWQ